MALHCVIIYRDSTCVYTSDTDPSTSTSVLSRWMSKKLHRQSVIIPPTTDRQLAQVKAVFKAVANLGKYQLLENFRFVATSERRQHCPVCYNKFNFQAPLSEIWSCQSSNRAETSFSTMEIRPIRYERFPIHRIFTAYTSSSNSVCHNDYHNESRIFTLRCNR